MRKKLDIIGILIKTFKLVWTAAPINMLFILIINVVTGVVVPINLVIWQKFLDSIPIYSVDSSIYNVLFWLGIYSIFLAIQEGLAYVGNYFKEMQTDYLNMHITDILLEKTNQLKLVDFDNKAVYDKINKINTEALSRSVSIINNLMDFVRNSISILGTVVILFRLSPIFIVVSMLAYVPVVLINIRIFDKLHQIYEERIEKLRLVEDLKWIQTRYENIKEIRIFQVGKYLKQTILGIYGEYLKEDKKIRKKNAKAISLNNLVHYITAYILKAAIVLWGIKRKESIGSISMYISSLDTFQQNLSNVMTTATGLYNDNLYVATLFDFIEENTGDDEGIEDVGALKEIVFENVYFKYPNTNEYILENVNLKFVNGKKYLLVGLNGAGKTTLIKLLCGLYEPTKGRVLLNGIDMRNYKKSAIYKLYSTVFQDFIRYPLDIETNIKIGDINNRQDDKKMVALVKLFDMDKLINNLPSGYQTRLLNEWDDSTELSGGQWQKIAICRALFAEAPILIMDEPSSALDVKAEDFLLENIRNIAKEKLCVIISHRFATAKNVDFIIVLKNKTIHEAGGFNELMQKKGEFYNLFKIQSQKYVGGNGENEERNILQ